MALQSPFPDPLVVPPLSTHKYTFVLLHGRGSSAANFGPALLSTPIPVCAVRTAVPGTAAVPTLASLFPHAKFIFPTAPRNRATVYKRSIINQWFDCWHINEDPDRDAWLMIEGLQQTTSFLHDLLRREATLVGGTQNVVVGGLSQGCAASLVGALLWEGESLGAFVGMCGWLPYKGAIGAAAGGRDIGLDSPGNDQDVDDFNPFSHSPVGGGEGDFDPFDRPVSGQADYTFKLSYENITDPCARAILQLREEIELQDTVPFSSGGPSVTYTPVFLGHGTEDEKVPIQLGKRSAECLESLGIHTSWHEYQGLGHWYSEDMLADLVHFLLEHTSVGME